jgi:cytochrome c-type biogenesis protein CcmH
MLCMTFSTSHASPGTPQDSAPQAAALSSADEARYQELITQLRCLVCQNQTIADSNAPLAADLRDQVRRQLEAGHSDAQIKRYLTDRYGDFVLYKPPFKASTALMWAGPGVLLVVALGTLAGVLRRRQRLDDQAFDPDTPDDDDALR